MARKEISTIDVHIGVLEHIEDTPFLILKYAIALYMLIDTTSTERSMMIRRRYIYWRASGMTSSWWRRHGLEARRRNFIRLYLLSYDGPFILPAHSPCVDSNKHSHRSDGWRCHGPALARWPWPQYIMSRLKLACGLVDGTTAAEKWWLRTHSR